MLKLLGAPRAVAGLSFDTTLDEISLHQSGCGDYHLHLVERGDKRRTEMEQYIADAYARVFGAALTRFYPSLVALHDREHRVLGAAGARSAADQPLFIEHYLPGRIEGLIAARAGPVCRDQVVEIGNLSISNVAVTYLFLAMLGEWLQAYDVQWLVFSLTSPLRRMLCRAGVPMIDLAPATLELAPVDGNDWGRYYDLKPRVTAVPAAEGLECFQNSFRTLSDGKHKRRSAHS